MDTPSCPPNDQTQTSLTIFQLCVINMIVGLTMEVSLTGLLTTYCRLVQQGVKNVWKTALIMSIFNVSSLFYMILFFMASFLTETNCIIQNYFVNLASHLMYLSFDFFLLYKTWVIAAHDQHILWGAIVLYLHRFSWSVADVILTHGQWDSLSQQCFSAQYPITGVGYNAADIIIDAYCTVVSVFFTVNLISTSFADVAKVIIGDNGG
ncbi:hypothetical protein BC830DRAFT_1142072 [Chytriomyces sp. MP71]|nr:hypothetical protein BC830DRAFT_1142072 [Chytriomyces sp. MP71]